MKRVTKNQETVVILAHSSIGLVIVIIESLV